MLAAALILLGLAASWLAISHFREFRSARGDFSDWIVSDATKTNRVLWRANAWVRMVSLGLFGPALVAIGLWLMLK
jgi:hypothetical protein